MRFERRLIPAIFKGRLNRFLGVVYLGGIDTHCFIPNPGRMKELLIDGAKVYLMEKPSNKRKTRYDLLLAESDGKFVSLDSRVPNRVVAEAIKAGKIKEFKGFKIDKKEPTFEDSRLDFLLSGHSEILYLEVKSCTLVMGGVGLFPDAPTSRGVRHVYALEKALSKGRAAILFLIQRSDANVLRPNEDADPSFTEAIREAACKGVEVYAYDSKVSVEGVFIWRRVKVQL